MEESVRRYILESFWIKYHPAGKKEEGALLDEICRNFTAIESTLVG